MPDPGIHNDLTDMFTTPEDREFFRFMCGEYLGGGMSRRVFRFNHDESKVVKVELPHEGSFQNVLEYEVWSVVHQRMTYGNDSWHADWFAPCYSISHNGRFLIQDYAEPLDKADLPSKVPTYFTDLKRQNWGKIDGRVVCVDYGVSVMLQTGLVKRLRKAEWWDPTRAAS